MDILILNKDKHGKVHLTEAELARLLTKVSSHDGEFDFYLGAVVVSAAVVLVSIGAGIAILLT